MFLSLVRPERISSPITSSAAVTGSLGADEFAVVMAARVLAARRSGPSLPCHCGGKCSVSLLRTCDGLGFNSGPYLARGPSKAKPGWPVGRRWDAVGCQPRNGRRYQGAPNGHLSDVHRAKTGRVALGGGWRHLRPTLALVGPAGSGWL